MDFSKLELVLDMIASPTGEELPEPDDDAVADLLDLKDLSLNVISPPANPHAGLGIDADLMSPLKLNKEAEEEDEESHSDTSSGRGNMSGKFSKVEKPDPPFQRDPLPTAL